LNGFFFLWLQVRPQRPRLRRAVFKCPVGRGWVGAGCAPLRAGPQPRPTGRLGFLLASAHPKPD
jgi:hypothetical protein